MRPADHRSGLGPARRGARAGDPGRDALRRRAAAPDADAAADGRGRAGGDRPLQRPAPDRRGEAGGGAHRPGRCRPAGGAAAAAAGRAGQCRQVEPRERPGRRGARRRHAGARAGGGAGGRDRGRRASGGAAGRCARAEGRARRGGGAGGAGGAGRSDPLGVRRQHRRARHRCRGAGRPAHRAGEGSQRRSAAGAAGGAAYRPLAAVRRLGTPYDIVRPAGGKALRIRQAVAAICADLGIAETDAVPVCLDARKGLYNVDLVWALIGDRLSGAQTAAPARLRRGATGDRSAGRPAPGRPRRAGAAGCAPRAAPPARGVSALTDTVIGLLLYPT